MPTKNQSLKEFVQKLEKFLAKNKKSQPSSGTLSSEFKLEYIGGGVSRRVFKHKKFPSVVFKLQSHGKKTCSPNYSEWRSYRKVLPHQKAVLAKPILISKNYRVLVMEEAKHMKVIFKEIRPFLKRARKVLPASLAWDFQSDYEPYNGINTELVPHNVGVREDGKYKIFDYASSATTCGDW